jgi:hypothetical protein
MQSQPSWSSRGDQLSKANGEEGKKKKSRGAKEELEMKEMTPVANLF